MTRYLPLAAAITLIASPAAAHLPPGEYGSFMAGFSHPLFGLDHILAMIAVGLWAALIGGRGMWVLPSAFVGAMLLGFAIALIGVPLPVVETMIVLSVIVIGLMVAATLRLPLVASAGLVGLFGLFHGHAHGGELGAAGALQFAIGFAIATAILHAIGVVVAYGAETVTGRAGHNAALPVRVLGGATALMGLVLAFG